MLVLLPCLAACAGERADARTASDAAAAPSAPTDSALRDCHRRLAPGAALAGGAESRETPVARFADALARRDTALVGARSC